MIPMGEPYYERDTFIYNADGLLTNRITFGADGIESKRNIYFYRDTLLEKENYILNGNLHAQYIYSHDQNGRLNKVDVYFKGAYDESWLYTYNSHGKQESFTVRDATDHITVRQTFEYDQNDLLTRHAIYDKGGQLIQLYLTYYNSNKLITHAESITGIQNGKLSTGEHELTKYVYAFRK